MIKSKNLKNRNSYPASEKSLAGYRIAITGSTGGLGKPLCKHLAKFGAKLILLDRNAEKSAQLKQELLNEFPNLSVTLITVDLEDMDAVKSASNSLITEQPDIFIHNAGAYSIPRKICSSGYDNVFQINFVSPYYIIKQLCEALPEIKVVAVGSIAHNYSVADSCDIDFRTRKSSALAYGNSKRFLMLSLHKLFENDNKNRLSIVHPGITFTNITAHYPPLIFAIIKHPMKVIFMRPKKAALCILEGLFTATPFGYWIGPRFFDVWGKPKLKKLKACFKDEAEQIHKIAEKIYFELKD